MGDRRWLRCRYAQIGSKIVSLSTKRRFEHTPQFRDGIPHQWLCMVTGLIVFPTTKAIAAVNQGESQ